MEPRPLVIIPVYNEAKTIRQVLLATLEYADRIIVVDDGSQDDSAEQAAALAAAYPQITLLRHPQNQGMSAALLTGFAFAWTRLQRGWLLQDSWVVTIDADGQHRPEEIPGLVVAAAERQVDVLLGRRSMLFYPRFKRVGNWGLSLWASLLSGYRYRDVECGFRTFRAKVLADLLRYMTGRRYGCAQEIAIITACCGWRVDNTWPVDVPLYRRGTRVWDGLVNLWMGLLAWWRVRTNRADAVAQRVQHLLGPERPTGTADRCRAHGG